MNGTPARPRHRSRLFASAVRASLALLCAALPPPASADGPSPGRAATGSPSGDRGSFEPSAHPAPATGFELSVVSYNIHGLPAWIAGDRPAERMPRIASHLNAYDVVLLQEDFAHHELLAEHVRHRVRITGNGPRSRLLAQLFMLCGSCGSGLTLLADLPPSRVAATDRVAFAHCHGWLGNGHDCWTSKGFVRLRLRLPRGMAVDLYDVHMDAGREAGDREVRARQLDQLRAAILARSLDNAVIVGGDFNLQWSDPHDGPLLRRFMRDVRLREAPTHEPGSPGGRVDYLFYRGGRYGRLSVIEAGIVTALSLDTESPLSDHAALFARFAVHPR